MNFHRVNLLQKGRFKPLLYLRARELSILVFISPLLSSRLLSLIPVFPKSLFAILIYFQ